MIQLFSFFFVSSSENNQPHREQKKKKARFIFLSILPYKAEEKNRVYERTFTFSFAFYVHCLCLSLREGEKTCVFFQSNESDWKCMICRGFVEYFSSFLLIWIDEKENNSVVFDELIRSRLTNFPLMEYFSRREQRRLVEDLFHRQILTE